MRQPIERSTRDLTLGRALIGSDAQPLADHAPQVVGELLAILAPGVGPSRNTPDAIFTSDAVAPLRITTLHDLQKGTLDGRLWISTTCHGDPPGTVLPVASSPSVASDQLAKVLGD